MERERRLLKLSQAECIEKTLRRFNMVNAKPVNILLKVHFKFSKTQEPKAEDEKALVSKVSCASAVDSLLYVIIRTRSDIV